MSLSALKKLQLKLHDVLISVTFSLLLQNAWNNAIKKVIISSIGKEKKDNMHEMCLIHTEISKLTPV